MTDINWTREWLMMTVLDYYGVAFCLAVIVVGSEDMPYGVLWSLGFCLLGSPIACLYIVYRLYYKGISLRERDSVFKNGIGGNVHE